MLMKDFLQFLGKLENVLEEICKQLKDKISM